MAPPLYPPELEQYWIQRAARLLDCPSPADALDRIRPVVARLSDLFTIARPGDFARYGNDAEAQLAYGLFFFPQTYARTRMVLQECRNAQRWVPPADRPLRILDLGAGLGAGLLAAIRELEGYDLSLRALDHATGSLATLREILEQQGRTAETREGQLLAPLPEGECWDLILCSFALNEALEGTPDCDVPAWIRSLIQHLHPGGLLVILEPALDAAAERMETLRDLVAQEGHGRIVAPCLHHLPCPLRQEKRGYCHEVRRWDPPESVAYLNRHLFRDLQVLKFCLLAITRVERPAPAPDPACTRLVAPVDLQNGKLVTRGCASDGRLYTYELLTRHLSRAERDEVAATERGSRVRWPGLQALKDGRTLRASGPPGPA